MLRASGNLQELACVTGIGVESGVGTSTTPLCWCLDSPSARELQSWHCLVAWLRLRSTRREPPSIILPPPKPCWCLHPIGSTGPSSGPFTVKFQHRDPRPSRGAIRCASRTGGLSRIPATSAGS